MTTLGEKELKYTENKEITVAMKTPILINGIKIKAIVDTGAATCAISKKLLDEVGEEIEMSSNVRCIMANGLKTASLGRTNITIETEEVITEIEVEVINSQERMLIIGNDFMNEWKAKIDFETHTLILYDQGTKIYIPVEYTKSNKIRFETPIQEEDSESEVSDEDEDFTLEQLEEEYISDDEAELKY